MALETKRILILGGGFGGSSAANLLRKNLPVEHEITVIDRKEYFMMGLVNLWILSGIRTLEDSKIALNELEKKGIRFLNNEVTAIDFVSKTVTLDSSSNSKLEYDYLVIALGTEFGLHEVSGFLDNGGFNLYEADQIPELRGKILSLKNGRIVICITSVPYKCPPAPYEASLLINDILLKNGTRDYVTIDIYTPTPIALPIAGAEVSHQVVDLLNDKDIHFHPLHKIKSVDKENIEFENGNRVSYDLLIGIPPHRVPMAIRNSDLIRQGQNYVTVDKYTLKTDHENVFAIGDVNEIKVNENMSIPKAGIIAEAQAKVVGKQIVDDINSVVPSASKFDGKASCFMEIGNKKAGFVNADFYGEQGPTVHLEPPSEDSYKKKIEFEKLRLDEWFNGDRTDRSYKNS